MPDEKKWTEATEREPIDWIKRYNESPYAKDTDIDEPNTLSEGGYILSKAMLQEIGQASQIMYARHTTHPAIVSMGKAIYTIIPLIESALNEAIKEPEKRREISASLVDKLGDEIKNLFLGDDSNVREELAETFSTEQAESFVEKFKQNLSGAFNKSLDLVSSHIAPTKPAQPDFH